MTTIPGPSIHKQVRKEDTLETSVLNTTEFILIFKGSFSASCFRSYDVSFQAKLIHFSEECCSEIDIILYLRRQKFDSIYARTVYCPW